MCRGEIFLVDFQKQIGSEQAGLRPAVVVQNETGNTFSPTTIVCPITSKTKSNIKTHVEIKANDGDIKLDSIILCEQIRVVDKQRLKRKLGEIKNKEIIEEINKKLMISLGVLRWRTLWITYHLQRRH